MVSELKTETVKSYKTKVLILVLVEDGLRDLSQLYLPHYFIVLILVLVEDGLRDQFKNDREPSMLKVLILVLVEDGLREIFVIWIIPNLLVLILVLVEDGLRDVPSLKLVKNIRLSLNPCSCGGWSQRYNMDDLDDLLEGVLILVLVEDGLRVHFGRI